MDKHSIAFLQEETEIDEPSAAAAHRLLGGVDCSSVSSRRATALACAATVAQYSHAQPLWRSHPQLAVGLELVVRAGLRASLLIGPPAAMLLATDVAGRAAWSSPC